MTRNGVHNTQLLIGSVCVIQSRRCASEMSLCDWLQYSVLTVLIVVAEVAGIALSAGVRQDVCMIPMHGHLLSHRQPATQRHSRDSYWPPQHSTSLLSIFSLHNVNVMSIYIAHRRKNYASKLNALNLQSSLIVRPMFHCVTQLMYCTVQFSC